MKQKIQSFGRFLSAMVMPNISIFIAWGLITAMFIPTGWFPNEQLNEIVSPMQRFLLPILIAYSGGKMIYKERGGIIGACAAIGACAGSSDPQFIAAMIMGPLGGWCMKKVDEMFEGHIKPGFEMLVNNFSAGILGFILAVLACLAVGPMCSALNSIFEVGVGFLVQHGLLPLTSILVEPAKVLFLNNAINHGIFTPMGMAQVAETGKSIFFLIESNPGPGLGLLMAYYFCTKGSAKESSLGAMIIEFFGGIHEIYFPYVLMNPITLLGVIAGGMAGVFVNVIMGSGLVSAASPGSIIAILGMCAKDSYIGVIASVLVAAAVSFGVNAVLLKAFGKEKSEEELEAAKNAVSESKAASKGAAAPAAALAASAAQNAAPAESAASQSPVWTLRKIVFACDAGMGSSAMGATILTKKLKAAGVDVTVPHFAINDIPEDTEVIVTHKDLADRARAKMPEAVIFPITNFMGGNELDAIVRKLSGPEASDQQDTPAGSSAHTADAKADKPAGKPVAEMRKIIFACDAGMGSSAMGATILTKKLKAAGVDVTVPHYAINDIPEDTEVIVTHKDLADRARHQNPDAVIFPITNFMGGSELDAIVANFSK